MSMIMPIWSYWVVGALFFVIAEVFTSGFAVICFSFGCLAAAICSACGVELTLSVAVFAVGSALALVTIRPLVIRYILPRRKQTRTNASAMIGKVVRVVEPIDGTGDTGTVRLDGSEWRAVATEPIAAGERVTIVAVDSVVLTVERQK